jgi:hypothetical protein
MRRIYKFDDYNIGCGPYVTIHKCDYRKLLAVARAAEHFEEWDYAGTLTAALDRLNAKPKRGKGAV